MMSNCRQDGFARDPSRRTFSVCPVCLKRVPAVLEESDEQVFLRKTCGEHGAFSAVVWRGQPSRRQWIGTVAPSAPEESRNCPQACGLCPDHRQDTCCVLLEVASRCNLACVHCFAGANNAAAGPGAQDPPLDVVKSQISDIAGRGLTFLQLSGGEPTLRDDLPQIVRFAREAGCAYVQLNTNGLRLGRDEDFVRLLAEAGLSFVFLQFDGLTDEICLRLRGKAVLRDKLAAIDACARRNIGVTLVPTLVPGVNTDVVGDMLRFAAARSPAVRGVHFQPVTYLGRYPDSGAPPGDERRFTLPETLQAVYDQAGELVPAGSIVPSRCDHPACGFHGAYVVATENGRPPALVPLTPSNPPECCCTPPAELNRRFVGQRWLRPPVQDCCADRNAGARDLNTLDGFLNRARSHAFTITAMAFQDAWTLDMERLRRCSLHVYDRGRIVPFCAYYLS
ncbi:MAG: radical SAM protein [Desulfovibrio sp.]|jgi:uncharacterized radical SAM superfamily Fe-S cluster-containing enzyme|nr:radical SAM protein [Desulfovibrio sp.]